ncbi:hypothetical protein [Streptacidiphilus sp. P02-A3a]|uniref:hypothetical protein n=1 Tax=Streptacidiphilus sp. P02-A3a TaxID=2704468 RepID=UPI0015FE3BD2|nr:hypothetical protein [Streptacidiphilus sp. P02-A3a]QMU72276.1 hypothetical protein GXP74_32565 [Streptacidiphilus sp. P02-A3a]
MTGAAAVSCGLPAGFHWLELRPERVRLDRLDELLAGMPDAPQGRPAEVFADYERALAALREQDVLLCALGLHQDARGAVCSSVLTLTARPLAGAAPGAVLAELRARAAGGASAAGALSVELPLGPALLLERRQRADAGRWLWSGTVAVVGAAQDRVAVLQLSSAASELAADYRAVLLGTAHTLGFAAPEPPRSRIADALG